MKTKAFTIITVALLLSALSSIQTGNAVPTNQEKPEHLYSTPKDTTTPYNTINQYVLHQ